MTIAQRRQLKQQEGRRGGKATRPRSHGGAGSLYGFSAFGVPFSRFTSPQRPEVKSDTPGTGTYSPNSSTDSLVSRRERVCPVAIVAVPTPHSVVERARLRLAQRRRCTPLVGLHPLGLHDSFPPHPTLWAQVNVVAAVLLARQVGRSGSCDNGVTITATPPHPHCRHLPASQ